MKWVIDIPDGYDLSKVKHGSIASNNILQAVKAGKPFKERPHGEWIEKEDYNMDIYYDCSVCGNSWCTLDGTPWQNGMNFCPNCGAKMKK